MATKSECRSTYLAEAISASFAYANGRINEVELKRQLELAGSNFELCLNTAVEPVIPFTNKPVLITNPPSQLPFRYSGEVAVNNPNGTRRYLIYRNGSLVGAR